jgi:hypothetical protein
MSKTRKSTGCVQVIDFSGKFILPRGTTLYCAAAQSPPLDGREWRNMAFSVLPHSP